MSEQRRHSRKALPVLEPLDERIAPSSLGMALATPTVAAERSSVRARAGNRAIHAKARRAHLRHARIQLAPQVVYTTPTVANASPASTGASVASQANVQADVSASSSSSGSEVSIAVPQAATSSPTTSGASTSGSTTNSTSSGSVEAVPTALSDAPGTGGGTGEVSNIKSGPLAKAGQNLATIYEEYTKQGSGASFTSSLSGIVDIRGGTVKVAAHSAGGSLTTYVSTLTNMGLQVTATDATTGTVEGYLPITQLPNAAQNAQTLSLSPGYIPVPDRNG